METRARSSRPLVGRHRFALGANLLAAFWLAFAGVACDSSAPFAPGPAVPPPTPKTAPLPPGTGVTPRPVEYPSASDVLGRMLNAYRTASTYQDEATIELSYRDGSQVVRDSADIAVVFQRPNRLRLRAYQTRVVADGTTWHAQVNDPGTNNLDGQVLERPCPESLTLRELYFDPLLYDQLGSAVLSEEAGRQPLQLELLLAEDEPRLLAGDELEARVLGVQAIDGHDCYHLQWKSPRGLHELWIDMEQFLIRRLIYPRGSLVEPLASAEELRDAKLTANFKNATLRETPTDDAFRWTSPLNAQNVRFFVRPPQPLPASPFGQKLASFSLQTLTGEELTGESLQGQTTVFVFFHDHPACEATLKQLSAVRETWRKREPSVTFYAVCTEPSTRGNDSIRDIARRWQIDVPLARDLKAIGRDLLKLDGAPALVVLGADGRLQLVEIGANPKLDEHLAVILDRLAQGADLAAEVLAESAAERRRYDQDIAIAQGRLDPLSAEIQTPLLPAAEFKKLKAKRVTDSVDADLMKQWLEQARSPRNTWRKTDGAALVRLEADEQGRVAMRSDEGQLLDTKTVSDWSVRRLATGVANSSSGNADDKAETPGTFGAIGVSSRGLLAFVALDGEFDVKWHYPLSRGATSDTCFPIQAGELFADKRPYWAVVSADGAVHLLSADGESSDFMAVGSPITGLALVRHEDRSLLIVATEAAMEAWELQGG